jgi:hypothetical protein
MQRLVILIFLTRGSASPCPENVGPMETFCFDLFFPSLNYSRGEYFCAWNNVVKESSHFNVLFYKLPDCLPERD